QVPGLVAGRVRPARGRPARGGRPRPRRNRLRAPVRRGGPSVTGILHGVRVLDFGRYIAGPYCAAVLPEFCADVIRVDKRGGSEDRFVSPLGEGLEGALFTQMNRGKRSITLDPMSPAGREVVHRLVASADVVIANLPPETLRAMGLDYGSLKAIRPD